ncbi:fumarylacetoacetate hydrolase family protein [Prosthecobacter dejongeii]|uniref:2-dehydro-3-deoxy-D-arabinonate dehydratase n=1 Tax=Prosthecobacter dejongeii TaxID=48465 RepID=A0A7W8DPZ9_9BACT|nr:fumarylacetoacetate hydrolase family protein [Prosthecobacter dejongeii]MBB5038194.1 2-dehydro-3-deoxy-D-arabinonate dehydratase [Prosthecobacter dejongeii]
MHLYRTTQGIYLNHANHWYRLADLEWDALFNHEDLHAYLAEIVVTYTAVPAPEASTLLAPIGTQEVWAAGVTYYRSRTARMEESKDAGGGTFYDRVYAAVRPEIFFKATPQRVAHPGQAMHLRSDSTWMVPEPELTLAINSRGEIIGYTVGNDLSCRDIEGENPLYLPQAKCFKLCAAVGPCIYVTPDLLPPETVIGVKITRGEEVAFEGDTTLDQLKRTPQELAEFLYRDNTFPTGALLMTGTGTVPGDEFTLKSGDVVSITIDGIGTLANPMG